MLTAKKSMLDRVEQSFEFLINSWKNFGYLVLPIFIYKLVFGVFIWNFISYVLLGNFGFEKNDIFSSPYYIAVFFLVIVGFILYITFFIGLLIATIKTIKDIFDDKIIDIKNNIKYGFDNLINSFNTYWYIFAYIVLWPFLFISLGGILIILGSLAGFSYLNNYGLYIMGFGFLLLLFFMIYRGIRTKFSILSAVNKNKFDKLNFNNSIGITKSNWWRIVGNFIFLGLILSFIGGIISIAFFAFKTTLFDVIDIEGIVLQYLNGGVPIDQKVIVEQIETYYNTFYFDNFIVSIFELFYTVTIYVFVLIFSYFFYIRLDDECQIKIEKKEFEL